MRLHLYIYVFFLACSPLAAAQQLPLHLNGAQKVLILKENATLNNNDIHNKHYTGKVKGSPTSWVRISKLLGQHWTGMIMLDESIYFIEDSPVKKTQNLEARPAAAITEQPRCGTHLVQSPHTAPPHSALHISQKLSVAFSNACSTIDNTCVFADLELIFDQEYQSALSANLQGSTDSIINMLEGYYLNQFNIAFNVINRVFLTDETDIYTNSTEASTVLNNVYSRRCEQQFGATTCRNTRPGNYDGLDTGPSHFIVENNSIVHFITGRDFDGSTAGIAFSSTGSYCNDFTVGATNLSRDAFNNVELSFTAAIIAHEIGHNFAADHDGSGNACPSNGFVMAATLGSLPSAFSSCSEEVITQTMADNLNNNCATAPVDLSISAGSVSSTPTVGSLLNISNAFSASSMESGFRKTGNASIEVTTSGATINSIDIGGNNCVIAASANSASCDLSVATGQVASNINITVAIADNAVSIHAMDKTNNLFKDTDRSNSNASLNFAASSAASAFSINANNIPPTQSKRPLISGTSNIPHGNIIRAQINGTEICNTTVSAVNWSCTPNNNIAEGTQTVALSGPGGAAANITVHIDTTAPSISANNVSSSSRRPLLSGTTDLSPTEGSIHVTTLEGVNLCTANINGGQWSCTPTRDLPLGNQVLNVTATDNVGNSTRSSLIATINTATPSTTSGGGGGGGGGFIGHLFGYLLLIQLLWRKQ